MDCYNIYQKYGKYGVHDVGLLEMRVRPCGFASILPTQSGAVTLFDCLSLSYPAAVVILHLHFVYRSLDHDIVIIVHPDSGNLYGRYRPEQGQYPVRPCALF